VNRKNSFCVGEWIVEPDLDRLSRGNNHVHLRPQIIELLLLLARNPGELVSLEEITSVIWRGKFVTSSSVYGSLNELRHALDDDTHEPCYIETISKKGYRLIATVSNVPGDGSQLTDAAKSLGALRKSLTHPIRGRPMMVSGLIALALLVMMLGINYPYLAARHFANNGTPVVDSSTNAVAQDHYLKGRFFYNRRAEGDMEKAEDHFQRALETDPMHALSWISLSAVYGVLRNEGKLDKSSWLEMSKVAVERALALGPELPEVQVRAASHYQALGEYGAAGRHFKRAAELGPNNTLVLSALAGRAAWDGNLDEAVILQRRAVAQDPLGFVNHANLANYLYASGQYEEAVIEKRLALDLNPSEADETEVFIGYALILQKQFELAYSHIQQWPEGEDRDLGLALIYAALGRNSEAGQAIDRLAALPQAESATRLAKVYAQKGNFDKSFVLLGEARDQISRNQQISRNWNWLVELHFCPFFSPLRTDPRWEQWLTETSQLLKGSGVG
jgi:DNA-binding winged helix-turn-helix (wHTH) protein/tetratricopeptide (TPR) repeat protein